MLKQTKILIESGDVNESIFVDKIIKNHFKGDDFYFNVLYTKKSALSKLTEDLDRIINILF